VCFPKKGGTEWAGIHTVAIIKKELKLDQSLYTNLQVLSVTLFEKDPILQVLTNNDYINLIPAPSNQLNLFE